MPSDLDRLRTLLDDFGVNYDEDTRPFTEEIEVSIFAQTPKVHGRSGHCAIFTFDSGVGRFIDLDLSN